VVRWLALFSPWRNHPFGSLAARGRIHFARLPLLPNNPATVEFVLSEINNLELVGCSHQNVINDLTITQITAKQGAVPAASRTPAVVRLGGPPPLRPTDIVGRWNGDEFIAIVHHLINDILMQLAERCRTMVAQISIPSGYDLPVSASVSIGGTLALPDDTADTVIKRADPLMYRNKTNDDLAKNGKPVL
jgi:hypothetical protein